MQRPSSGLPFPPCLLESCLIPHPIYQVILALLSRHEQERTIVQAGRLCDNKRREADLRLTSRGSASKSRELTPAVFVVRTRYTMCGTQMGVVISIPPLSFTTCLLRFAGVHRCIIAMGNQSQIPASEDPIGLSETEREPKKSIV